jgi:hypothetical protein
LRRGYAKLARERYGVFTPGGWWRRHRVDFHYGEARVTLQPRTKSGIRLHELEIDWPDPQFRCEIFRAGVPSSARTRRGLANVAVGCESFDHHYVVLADNPVQARALLSGAVRRLIDRLDGLLDGAELQVGVRQGRLRVSKAGRLRRHEELEDFTQLALELYDQAMLARGAGIEFLGEESAQVVEAAICQVCGEEIGDDMVVCVRCKTPHHGDCWRYNGGCSVYGCRETRCSEVRG